MDVNAILLIIIFSSLAYTQDNRCYLENGGSAESFFVSENLPVGSIVGSLKIYGDASEFGNIILHLKELDSPVTVVPYAKNLSLVHILDKEGLEGPSSVLINVICDRKRTLDPSFIIPVNIRVIDVNDNAPRFINAPYKLNVSEVTVVGTKVLQDIRAIDADQQGPFATVHYSVLPGKYSDYFEFANGLEGTLVLKKSLDYETVPNFTIAIRAQDQGNPPLYSDTTIYVSVIDADDQNPKFVDSAYFATLPEHSIQQGTKLKIYPRDVEAFDQDTGINAPIFYTFSSDGPDYQYFEINKSTGSVYIKVNITDDHVLQPALLVIKAVQYDNSDKYALATLTISRSETSVHNLQFLHNQYFAAVLENVPVQNVILTVATNRPHDKKLRYWLSNFDDMFNVNSDGEIILIKPLDYELVDNYGYLVFAGNTYTNVSTSVNITVLNVNDWDPRFRYPQYEFVMPNVSSQQLIPGTVVGSVEAADGDRDDRVTLSLRGPHARLFSISDFGEIRIQELIKTNSSTIHLVAVATDSGIPPRQASVPVIIHLSPSSAVNSSDYWIVSSSSSFVMITFIAILAVLSLVIITLIVYIQKYKAPKQRSLQKFSKLFKGDERCVTAFGKIENPVFNSCNDIHNMMLQTTCDPAHTATVKRTSSHGCPSRNKTNSKSSISTYSSKVVPVPPKLPNEVTNNQEEDDEFVGNDIWSVNSLSSRVKNLNWNDEANSVFKKTRLDPDVSVTPLVNDPLNLEHLNLTVYF